MGPMNGGGPALAAPERNRFFFGKMMNVTAFEMEQSYFLSQRRLLNRLAVGTGVVCGLGVEGGTGGQVAIAAGLAIDGHGREIVVPEPVTLDPRQLTDDAGEPAGEPIAEGTVELCLAYRESCIHPVPVLIANCDTLGDCACGTTREGFRILVRMAEGELPPPGCIFESFPPGTPEELRAFLDERISQACPERPARSCVPLARVTVETTAIEDSAVRPLVFSNALLGRLVVCLAASVGATAATRVLNYVSGDGQSAQAGSALANPLVVSLTDGSGNPIPGTIVQFTPAAGSGSVQPASVETGADGTASANWTLGPQPGPQQVTAAAAGSSFSVTMRATAL